MNAPRDLGPEFRTWLADAPPMPADLPARTLELTRVTRQRRRWLWFLPGPKSTAGTDELGGRMDVPAHRPVTGGLASARIGGTTTMFTATRLVALATVMAVIGSLSLVLPLGQPKDPTPPTAPAAVPSYVTEVSGTMKIISSEFGGAPERGAVGGEGLAFMGQLWTSEYDMDDPRLDGRARHRVNHYDLHGQSTRAETIFLQNDGGAWAGTAYAYADPDTRGLKYRQILEGQGGYEGLVAIVDAVEPRLSGYYELTGAIIAGGLPPMPEPAPSTFESQAEG